jgi:hypothetical protein
MEKRNTTSGFGKAAHDDSRFGLFEAQKRFWLS